VNAVYSCFAGTIYPGSFYTSPVLTSCPLGLRDACLKVYSNTARAMSYSCAAKESCGTSVSLNGVTSSSICCYSDNCNSATNLFTNKIVMFVSFITFIFYEILY